MKNGDDGAIAQGEAVETLLDLIARLIAQRHFQGGGAQIGIATDHTMLGEESKIRTTQKKRNEASKSKHGR